jgi:probable rRNA maturation factor
MLPSIYFHSEDTHYTIKHKKAIKQWMNTSIENENHTCGEINIILCSDEHLHKMNVEHLNHDTYTDIITFDYTENNLVSGDLFISIDRVRENAKTHKTALTNEFNRVIIHGTLHLLGYTDKSPEHQLEMTSKEDFYLSLRKF